MQTSQEDVHLPPIPCAFEYLLGFFFGSGQAMQTGQGLIPLTWQEIKSYREENELEICVWERELLKAMSEAYCAEAAKATDEKRPPPYSPPQISIVDESEEVQLAKAFAMREQMRKFRQQRS